jgi:hypothetical protein
MKLRISLLTLLVFLSSAIVCAAQDPNLGTWKLNEAKSKIQKGAAKNQTVIYEMSGDQVKVTVDGVDGDGNATHSEWTGKYDGKYYAVTGSPTSDMRSYRKINKRTLSIREKKGSKVVTTGTITVATNGKSRTVSVNGTDAKGKRFHTTAVYDKQ